MRITLGAHRESRMSSTRDPVLLLEPSHLLEPLNLQGRYVEPANQEAGPGRDGTSPRGTARTTRSGATSAPTGRGGRWPLKSALIVAGGLACFGAGAALPELPNLMFGDIKH